MPVDPKAPVRPASRVQARTQAAILHTEGHDRGNYNRTLPPDPRDQRGDRHVWPIKVTDQPSLGTPYLWPAVVRYWSGYAAGVHSFDDWPDDAVVDIWAFVMPTSAGLETDGEYLGVFVGVHTDGVAVFETVNAGTGDGSGGTGPSLNVVTSVCEGSSGLTLEFRTVTFPAGTTISDPWCEDDPECCPVAAADITEPCCPDDPLPTTLYATISGRGTFPLVRTGSYWRIDANWPECADPDDNVPNGDWILYFQCADTGGPIGGDTWQLGGNGFTVEPDSFDCAAKEWVFLDVPIHGAGGPCASTLYDVTVHT